MRASFSGLSLLAVTAVGCAPASTPLEPTSTAASSSETAATTTTTSSSSGGGRGTGGQGGTTGEGGSAGAGTGGMGTGGMGTGGMGTGGMGTGGMGTGGMGTGGMGTGGAGGAGPDPTGTLVVLGGRGLMPATEARFTAQAGWSSASVNLFVTRAAVMPYQGGALAVARKASLDGAQNDSLQWSKWSEAGFAAFQSVGANGFGIDGPSLAGVGDTATLVFLGQDHKHYTALLTNSLFAPFAPLPAGMVQNQAFGQSSATATSSSQLTWAAYAGDDANLYFTLKSSPGGAWEGSSLAPSSPVINTVSPAAIADASGNLFLYYSRASDHRICVVERVIPQNSWIGEKVVHASALTASAISVTATRTGDYLVAWRGNNNQGIYFTRGDGAAFGAPVTIDVPALDTTTPTATPGLGGADAEIVYAAGGKLQHARVTGNTVSLAEVPAVSSLTGVAAAVVP